MEQVARLESDLFLLKFQRRDGLKPSRPLDVVLVGRFSRPFLSPVSLGVSASQHSKTASIVLTQMATQSE